MHYDPQLLHECQLLILQGAFLLESLSVGEFMSDVIDLKLDVVSP